MKKSILAISFLALIACGKKPEGESAATAPAAISGEAVFNGKGCATCHGAQGKGDGVVGAGLNPKPRNFADAKWKFGFDLATVKKTIRNGSPGTGMGAYSEATVSEAELTAVAEYVRKLGGKN